MFYPLITVFTIFIPFDGKRGQRVIIDMMSDDFDSYLILLDIDGNELAQDDDGGDNTNARIDVTLPATGTYTLLANSYQGWRNRKLSIKVAGCRRSPFRVTLF